MSEDTGYGFEALEQREESMFDPWWWPAAVRLYEAALPEIEEQRGFLHAQIDSGREQGISEDDINLVAEAYHAAEEKQRDWALWALFGVELPEVALNQYERWRRVARAAIGMDDPPDEAEDADGQMHDLAMAEAGAVQALVALAAAEGAAGLRAVLGTVPRDEMEALSELLGSSYTSTAPGSHEPAGQTIEIELAGPRGEGHPADSWAMPLERAPGIAENAPSRPPRSKALRRRRLRQLARAAKRAAKARRA